MADFDRRDFLKSLGALGLATLPNAQNIARGPLRKLFPELLPAEEIIPGMPYWYTSTCRECPAGCGVLLKVRENNVIKIEGNPQHPLSQGGLCQRGQAALQELYHPERLRQPQKQTENQSRQNVSWQKAMAKIQSRWTQGKTVLLSGHLTGSQQTFAEKWVAGLPGNSELVIYELVNRNAYLEANKILFNQTALPEFHLAQADLVLSFGADFMETWQSPVALTRAFSKARRYHDQKSAKFIYVGSTDSLTGANADEEYKILPRTEIAVLLALANYLLSRSSVPEKGQWQQTLTPFTLKKAAKISGLSVKILQHLGDELLARPQAVVLAGENLTAHKLGTWSQVAVNILNYIAGHYGQTISLQPARPSTTHADFEQLVQAMEAGEVRQLILHQTNPRYTFPDSARLAAALKKVPLKLALVTNANDTSALADFVLPVHHTIETWGLEMPVQGIYSLVQPGMAPVFDSKPFEEILQQVRPVSGLPANLEKFVENEWKKILGENGQSPENWENVLQQGGFWTESAPSTPTATSGIHARLKALAPKAAAGPVLAVTLSHRLLDGRGANKSWLWEIPDQIHQTVWETPLRVHPNLAKKLDLKEGETVNLNQKIEAPVLISPDVHPEVVAIELGGGHENYATAIEGTGNPLQVLAGETDPFSGDAVLFAEKIEIKKTGKWRKIVRLQGGYDQGPREIIQTIPLAEAIALEKQGAHRKHAHAPQIYPEHEHPDFDWTMVVDLSACIGCGACAAACYAENNLPVVGKQQCDRGREMAWLHVERFETDGRPRFIPMMCQQCEEAPCETVCPVYATVHSNEGLNLQIYNRCVGTRYCSNNCPYKARRFNYFPAEWPEPSNRQLNPDIYHRPKGVMEKCTFCVQRIRLAKENAKVAGRSVQDQEVIPACAQSCPTQAITFGNINDPNSRVAQLLENFRGYTVFESLNTKPSVIYLKGIKHE